MLLQMITGVGLGLAKEFIAGMSPAQEQMVEAQVRTWVPLVQHLPDLGDEQGQQLLAAVTKDTPVKERALEVLSSPQHISKIMQVKKSLQADPNKDGHYPLMQCEKCGHFIRVPIEKLVKN